MGSAYRAARDGHRVTLVERAGHVGGAAASHSVAGVRVDLGSHRLHPTIEPRILAELRALLGDDLQRRPRNGRIRLGGRWIAFPLRPLDLARRLPPAMAAGALRDAALGPLRPGPRADTFEEVLRSALGPTLCERFYFPYARKLWGLDPSELAGEQARRRVAARSPGRLVARALARGSAGKRFFLYPR
ncbi:MAG: NAD(P)/FAD-dependent oxidoreductase, partial [Thermoleophilia bacterium]